MQVSYHSFATPRSLLRARSPCWHCDGKGLAIAQLFFFFQLAAGPRNACCRKSTLNAASKQICKCSLATPVSKESKSYILKHISSVSESSNAFIIKGVLARLGCVTHM